MLRRRQLEFGALPIDFAEVRGGALATGAAVLQAFEVTDMAAAHPRGEVGRVSLAGAESFQVGTQNAFDPERTLPAPGVSRIVHAGVLAVLPGHVLLLSVIAAPSGQTQIEVSETVFKPGPPGGAVRLQAIYTGLGAPVPATATLTIPAAPGTGALAQGSGQAWQDLIYASAFCVPPGYFGEASVVHDVSEAQVQWFAYFVGSPRVVDLRVEQVPYAYARDLAADVSRLGLAVGGNGSPLPSYPPQTAVTQRSASDPGLGSLHLAAVARAQAQPPSVVLWSWSAWSEDTAPLLDDRLATRTVDVTGLTSVAIASMAGSWSQPWSHSGPGRELDGRAGMVAVVVDVYAWGEGIVRVTAGGDTWVEILLDEDELALTQRTGWLRVGVGVPAHVALAVSAAAAEGEAIHLFAVHVRARAVVGV